MVKNKIIKTNSILLDIRNLLQSARTNVLKQVNNIMVVTYFKIGKRIVEEEQKGNKRAGYGEKLIVELSKKLTKEFGKGFSITNLKQMRTFYIKYKKSQTVFDQFKLSWSHYLKLISIDDEQERKFYEIESEKNNWSVRELQRQFDSALYTRLSLSRNKKKVLELSKKGQLIKEPQDVIKDPYILEFVGLDEKESYSETELETAIINKLEDFLLELGKGFTFVARQQRISFNDKHFYCDLVFYNRILKSFVLIDLKIGELKHQDIGQMQMYVNYYDRNVRLPEENKTIGIILCRDKNEAVVEYTLPENSKNIFTSKYQTVLPNKKQLQKLLQNKK